MSKSRSQGAPVPPQQLTLPAQEFVNQKAVLRRIRNYMAGQVVGLTRDEALLEEFDAKEKAVYLPPRNDRVFAFVPLGNDPGVLDFGYLEKVPLRVLVNVGGSPGLFIFPPGSEIVRLSLLPEDTGLEDALQYVLVDYLEGAGSVKAIKESGTDSPVLVP